jgi:hypothetical protein
MAKKQTRRSISVSRTTYERLKAFCETNHISMSQLVETRVNDFLVASGVGDVVPSPAMVAPRPAAPLAPRPVSLMPTAAPTRPSEPRISSAPTSSVTGTVSPAHSQAAPMTSAAARFAIEPPPPIIKPRQETAAPKPAEKRPEQIFTF